jgi:Carboxypeptidase regulatory-like domain
VVDLPPCRAFVRGTVRDAGGAIAGARVRFAAPMNNGGVEAITDSGGRYELCIRGESHHYALVIEASGYAAVETEAPAASRSLDFVLEPQGIVAGRAVREDDGEPAAGVSVILHPQPPADANHPPEGRTQPVRLGATTDAAGQFEIGGVAAGRYAVRVAGDEAMGMAAATVTVAGGEHVRGQELRLAPVAVVEGEVFRQGALAPDADLLFEMEGLEPVRNRANAAGRFRVRLPHGREVRVRTLADPANPRSRWVPVASPSTLRAGHGTSAVRIEVPRADALGDVTPPGAPAPPPGHALEARFGDLVRFAGYDVAGGRLERGGALEVTLHFQAVAPPAGWRLFAHLEGPGRFINLDHTPVRGSYPVDRWRTGETIRDRFDLRVPATAPPGTYTLLVGFWKPPGARLPVRPAEVADGQDRLRVLTVTVE